MYYYYYYYPSLNFELDLNFNDRVSPTEAFTRLANFYEKLALLDNEILSNVAPDFIIKYELENVAYGSIKSTVRQVLGAISDDTLKDKFARAQLVGRGLLYAKHRILRAIQDERISARGVQEITNDINREFNDLHSSSDVTTNVAPQVVSNSIERLVSLAAQLNDHESYKYTYSGKQAEITNTASFNKQEVLEQLGFTFRISETTETLAVKSIELTENRTTWKFLRLGKTISIKITDKRWLANYYKREIEILPNDSLKMRIKISVSYNPNLKETASYEAVEVLDVVAPTDVNQLSIQF